MTLTLRYIIDKILLRFKPSKETAKTEYGICTEESQSVGQPVARNV